jgi:hypothetical protein
MKVSAWTTAAALAVLFVLVGYAILTPGPFVGEGGPSDAAVWLSFFGSLCLLLVLISVLASLWQMWASAANRTSLTIIVTVLGIAVLLFFVVMNVRAMGSK